MVTTRKYKNGFNQRTYDANKHVALDKSLEKKYKDLLQARKDVWKEAQGVQDKARELYGFAFARKQIPQFSLMKSFADSFATVYYDYEYNEKYGEGMVDKAYDMMCDFLVKGGNSSEYKRFHDFDRQTKKMYIDLMEFCLSTAMGCCYTYLNVEVPMFLEASKTTRNNSIKVRARKFNRPTIPRFKGYNTKCSCEKSSKRR